VAPATADFLARAAHGHADDLLTAILLAATCPVLLAPAMNDRMWAHAQTQRNVALAREIGYTVLDPEDGPLAVGEGNGPGRLPEPHVVLAHFGRLIEPRTSLRGKHVVVTAGATREAIDPVRFLSNHSSGKMGVAIAAAAWRRGARVTLIAGHLDVAAPIGVDLVHVESVADMQQAVRSALAQADVLVMAAAPADFHVAETSTRKIKKGTGALHLDLVSTADILVSTMPDRRPGTIVVGFALETDDLVPYAQAKLRDKQLDLVVANRAGAPGEGFGADTNRVTLLDKRGEITELPLMSKDDVADHLLDRIGALVSE
ncbi:MAG TPA: bifunctional phosphopantothenoylcysteine decarboxylase/phosphopantothenate--cysteine ligase CoaBC, partial [Gemmatimonadaceae bacterium]|jgi:phosphopantothenoylcysteine decarboxylase/phosphopantothenate--cysteine ligase|nr:bifunctional phosphopantothenoylcysteine decarboxylase/phosphopantothenate--cysteine ligase CoaBC [Gemmatimonadaceae bacterium]